MKLLGYMLGDKPGAAGHIEYLEEKVNRRLWILRKLRSAGWRRSDIVKIYKSIVRPMFDYCAVVYHPLLNRSEAGRLEALQRRAIRIACGFNICYERVAAEYNIELLSDRRLKQLDKFVLKNEHKERFGRSWFKIKGTGRDLRCKEKYQVPIRTSRRYDKNPVTFYTKRLNYLHKCT